MLETEHIEARIARVLLPSLRKETTSMLQARERRAHRSRMSVKKPFRRDQMTQRGRRAGLAFVRCDRLNFGALGGLPA
jgi:hypothetical protein